MMHRHPGRSSWSRFTSLTGAVMVVAAALGCGPAAGGGAVLVAPGASLDIGSVLAMIRQDLPPPEEGAWDIRILQPTLPLTNPAAEPLSVALAQDGGTGPDPSAAVTRTGGALLVTDGSGRTARLPFSAELHAMVMVPVPLRALAADTALEAEMFGEAAWPRQRVDDQMVRSLGEIVGARLARRLPPGRPIPRSALQAPWAVHRDEPVRITFVRGGLRLTVTGHAQEDAAVGELARAINAVSERQVRGRVTAPGEITIGDPAR
jgi:flagella basal body P-ring formation protein FlgA